MELPRSDDGRLPLAAARNVGATSAVDAGADLLVFLDVDCLAAPDLLSTYASAWGRVEGQTTRPAILCSAVAYLLPSRPTGPGTVLPTSRKPNRIRHDPC